MECSTVLEQIVIPAGVQEADAQTRYEAALVLTLLLLAKMSGERGMSGMAQ